MRHPTCTDLCLSFERGQTDDALPHLLVRCVWAASLSRCRLQCALFQAYPEILFHGFMVFRQITRDILTY